MLKNHFETGVMINGEMTYKGLTRTKQRLLSDTVGDPFKKILRTINGIF
jgi:K(+)-stimulated pyrophosphate-energized sodium pump